MIRLMLIPESIDMARAAIAGGVDRIFIDLERAGKFERQGGGTWISTHTIDDVAAYRSALPDTELLVRVDPWPELQPEIVERVVAAGVDLIMLPMIESANDVETLAQQIDGRAGLVPLIETRKSAEELDAICAIKGVSEIFVGLNDLHRQLDQRFMFEPLADGLIDSMAATAAAHGKPFGFGGMARLGRGDLPSDLILAEHVRLGSSAVILSRKFKDTAGPEFDWGKEIRRIRDAETRRARRTPEDAEADRAALVKCVREIVASMKAAV